MPRCGVHTVSVAAAGRLGTGAGAMEPSLLGGWENFYVITGSSAGGLTGLMFVVITLIRDVSRVRVHGLRAWVTPTIVHFGAVLSFSAFMSVPHQTVLSLSLGFGLAGVAGLVYCGVIAANMRRTNSEYVPVREDWVWNVVVPAVLYAFSIVAAAMIHRHRAEALYGMGAVALALLFLGIRNSWDIAVYMTLFHKHESH